VPNSSPAITRIPHSRRSGGGRGDRRVAVVHVDRGVGIVGERRDTNPGDQGSRRALVALDLVVELEIAGVPEDDVVAFCAPNVAGRVGLQKVLVRSAPVRCVNQDREVSEVGAAASRCHPVRDGDRLVVVIRGRFNLLATRRDGGAGAALVGILGVDPAIIPQRA